MKNFDLDPEQAFLSEVSWHYYVNNMTQADIARNMGTTRLRINQAIREAKERGIVKISIETPYVSRLELQKKLEAKLNLKRVIIAPANRMDYEYHDSIGAALANYLVGQIEESTWKKIGVSWGVTLQSAANHLPQRNFPELEIISIMGGTSLGEQFNSFGIASSIAEKFNARYSLLAAPIYISKGVDRNAFLNQEIFKAHFEKFNNLDAVVLTASNISKLSYLIKHCLPQDVDLETIKSLGAIGDVVGRFMDAEGRDVTTDLDGRLIGIELDVLKKTPDKILAAAGKHKAQIIRAAIMRGLVNTLITDDYTAELLNEQI